MEKLICWFHDGAPSKFCLIWQNTIGGDLILIQQSNLYITSNIDTVSQVEQMVTLTNSKTAACYTRTTYSEQQPTVALLLKSPPYLTHLVPQLSLLNEPPNKKVLTSVHRLDLDS